MPPSSFSSWSQFPAETSCKLTTSYIGRCVSPPVCESACALHPCGLQRKWMLFRWSAAKSPGQLLTPNPLLFIINLSLFLSHLCSCPLSSFMGFLRESVTLCLPLDCPSWIQFKKNIHVQILFSFFRTDKKEHSAESICKKWDSIQKAHKVLSASSSVWTPGMLTLLFWATKPSLNLAFYHFPSRITQDISAAIQLISSSKLPLPVIYISQSPSTSFPLLWSHLSSAHNTNKGCGLKILTQVFGKYRAKHSKAASDSAEPGDGVIGDFYFYLSALTVCEQNQPVCSSKLAGIYQQNLTNGAVFPRNRYRVWNTWITRNAKNCQRKEKISLAA